MRKLQDVVVYSDDAFYAAFPSVVARPDGELLVAFRRAPERRRFYAPGCTHSDPNSYLVLVRSRDNGRTWSREPELIYAHPFGGSQDPCMVQLDDGSLLVSSYAWMLLPKDALTHDAGQWGPTYGLWHFTFLGGYVMRSTDGGRTWQGPMLPPRLEHQRTYLDGVPIHAMNRGAMAQARDGKLYWIVAADPAERPGKTMLDLLISGDRGLTWDYAGPVAWDERVGFNETSLIQTAGEFGGLCAPRGLWRPWRVDTVAGHGRQLGAVAGHGFSGTPIPCPAASGWARLPAVRLPPCSLRDQGAAA